MNSDNKKLNKSTENIIKNGQEDTVSNLNINSKDGAQNAKWIDNQGNEVEKVFGFNKNAELVNSRAAMFGFFMLILTELVFHGQAATKSIFGIGL
tara:strand:- start:297 stop:581 length:285 start_codon:yes stop_codon:yes gene_type:complete